MEKMIWHKGEQPSKEAQFLLIRDSGCGIEWIVPDRDVDYSQFEWMYFSELCDIVHAYEESHAILMEYLEEKQKRQQAAHMSRHA